jgi:hypothetical protein
MPSPRISRMRLDPAEPGLTVVQHRALSEIAPEWAPVPEHLSAKSRTISRLAGLGLIQTEWRGVRLWARLTSRGARRRDEPAPRTKLRRRSLSERG